MYFPRHKPLARLTTLLVLIVALPAASARAMNVPTPQSAAHPAGGSLTWRSTSTTPTKIAYIGLENMGLWRAMKHMPYLKGLSKTYGKTVGLQDSLPDDPSLPHYLLDAFGTSFGVHDDKPPRAHSFHGQTIYGNAVANGRTARIYNQSMTGTCALTDQGTLFKVRHEGGLPYALDERTLCSRISVPLEGNLKADVSAGTLPNLGWIDPDVAHDGHKPSTPADADTYLRTLIPMLMSGPDYARGNLVIVVSADETSGSQPMLWVTIHPSLHGVKLSEKHSQLDVYRTFLRFGGSPRSSGDMLTGYGL